MAGPPDRRELTTLLLQWREGDREAGNRLFSAAYQELRRLARQHMRNENAGHTLQPTAIVHELYLRLFGAAPIEWQSRAHFFSVAAHQLRRILIDHARRNRAEKRRGGRVQAPLSEVDVAAPVQDEDLVDLDEALLSLEDLDPRAAQVVELRYFGGLTETEAAAALGISLATLKRDWAFARAWLIRRMNPPAHE